MKPVLSFLLVFAVCFNSTAQQPGLRPFNLIVLPPDTAVIDRSLSNEIDSIHVAQLDEYYTALKHYEEANKFMNKLDIPVAKKKSDLNKDLALMKAREDEVKNFRFFHLISLYSSRAYKSYFKQLADSIHLLNKPFSEARLKGLADHFATDYIVRFSDIHTSSSSAGFVLLLTTSIFSRKEGAVIWSKQTEGDAVSRVDWPCGKTMLSCLLTNAARTSVLQVIPALINLQKY